MDHVRDLAYYLMVVVVVGVCSLTALAQFPRERGPAAGQSRIVSGDDIGFRVEGADPRTGNPTGVWVIKVNGAWVEVASMPVIRPAK